MSIFKRTGMFSLSGVYVSSLTAVVAGLVLTLAGCGATSTGPNPVPRVVSQPSTVSFAVQFPSVSSQGASALISPLLSTSTNEIKIAVYAGTAANGQLLGSTFLLAPVAGGTASGSITIPAYSGPALIEFSGYDTASGVATSRLSYSVNILPGVNTPVNAAMIEFGQGMVASGPSVILGDGTTYSIYRIFVAPYMDLNGINHYNVAYAANVTTAAGGPYTAVVYSSALMPVFGYGPGSSYNGILSATLPFFYNQSKTIGYAVDVSLDFRALNNSPTVTLGKLVGIGGGVGTVTGFPVTAPWQNNMTVASAGVVLP